MRFKLTLAIACALSVAPVLADEPPPARSVAEIQARHDRAMLRELAAYAGANPKADDLDQAYMALFDKVIEHDWFVEHEPTAKRYLADFPDGPVRSLAQIVGTMARAQADDYPTALSRFTELMAGLGQPEQEEFASNFAEGLAVAATEAGEYAVARKVYETLAERYADSPAVTEKTRGELNRLDKVGKPAPAFTARDVAGRSVTLDAYRGKYVLIDFWATWCAPCVAELPRLQAAHAAYRDRGFEVLGVSLDENPTAVTDFVKARSVPWRQVHNASADADLVEAFGVTTIPATFLVDPLGRIVRLELRGADLDKALKSLIGEPGAVGKVKSPVKIKR